jgi:spore maturation protein CgeB
MSSFYDPDTFDPGRLLADADLVIVHEFNEHRLIKLIGEYRASHDHFRLLFHDTHHRSVSRPEQMAKYDLCSYDGLLAFGESICEIYLKNGWAKKAWSWHEAADTEIFKPIDLPKKGDVVWIGGWGDDERSQEIIQYIVEPIRELNLKAAVYGVRYPPKAIRLLQKAGITYGGYLPNYKIPEVFAQYKATIHVPSKYYSEKLNGIPTIRPFEAMACGIPLISAPWEDSENLFKPGEDFLMAHSKQEIKNSLVQLLTDPGFSKKLSQHGLETIRQKHTCAHRARSLMKICKQFDIPATQEVLANQY